MPVVAPRGEAREEWQIVDALSRRDRHRALLALGASALARLGYRITPQRLLDVLLRTGRDGDLFGLRRARPQPKWLRKHPHGVVTAPQIPTGVLPERVRHPGGKVRLDHAALREELARLGSVERRRPGFPLRLIGLRELRSHNSWMHNAPLLMRGGASSRCACIPTTPSGSG